MMKIMPVDQFDAEDFKTPPIQAGNEIEAAVDDIIRCVREKGDQALIDYAARFDHAIIDNVVVSDKEIEEAFNSCDPEFLETLRLARDNIEAFHSHQKRNSFTVCDENGKVLGQRIIPLRRVGLYVPGGTASYPSSVLMNAIPPKIAGVKDIVITTPPGKDGKIAPAILCAAKIAGVTRIMTVGGGEAVVVAA